MTGKVAVITGATWERFSGEEQQQPRTRGSLDDEPR
jgi:hypothetical protein